MKKIFANDEVMCDKEYICIAQWGIKIKLSDGLSVLNDYAIEKNNNEELAYIVVVDDEMKNVLENYPPAIVGTIPGTYIVKTTASEINPFSFGMSISPIFTDDEYNYFAYQPTGYGLDDSLIDYSNRINEVFKNSFDNMFNKTGSYSKI